MVATMISALVFCSSSRIRLSILLLYSPLMTLAKSFTQPVGCGTFWQKPETGMRSKSNESNILRISLELVRDIGQLLQSL